MTKGTLVVGRFSGFHRGHATLIQKAYADHPNNIIIVGIVVGKKSSADVNKNPFTFDQRKEMIEKILHAINIDAYIIQLASDISNDELNISSPSISGLRFLGEYRIASDTVRWYEKKQDDGKCENAEKV